MIFCDIAQQWGRLKPYNQFEDIKINLKNVIVTNDKVEIQLSYPPLGQDLKSLIDEKMSPAVEHWFTVNKLEFMIHLYWEGTEEQFDTIEHKIKTI